ncbi:hypothetical protein SAMN04489860_0789 [Paraoerskovia marina]|uniref:TnsA endonuclease N terminal n=1 Tax=Paraoerskovia marina TaxID=545619 RepID=A0A1H1PFA2_9CELL|nr:TnsA-like heteromeric transposase endonuclease subunit [Paraoerskovia marina]SDS09777.1 hypothetical protein SAMN04489860_0789 [Paraoerskovia marina]
MPNSDVEVRYRTRTLDDVITTLDAVDAQRIAAGSPVREFPVYMGRANYSGYFWSATMRDHVVYESLLEQSWLWLADFAPEITCIAAQPMYVRGPDGDRFRTRVPDFLCLTSSGSVRVVDVKPAPMLKKSEVTSSLAWMADLCSARGWEYDVWTGPDPVVLRNVRWIAAARSPQALEILDARSTVRSARGGATFADLESRLISTGCRSPRLEILGALWLGLLSADLRVPLAPDSWLEPASV